MIKKANINSVFNMLNMTVYSRQIHIDSSILCTHGVYNDLYEIILVTTRVG